MKNIIFNTSSRASRILVFIAIDALSAALAVYLSLFVRYVIEYSAVPTGTIEIWSTILVIWLPVNILIFAAFKMYNRIWEYASIKEAIRAITAVFCSSVALVIIAGILKLELNKSCYPLIWIFLTALTLTSRFFYRFIRAVKLSLIINTRGKTKIMIIGAGNAGNALIREIEKDRHFSNMRVACIIDDNPLKLHKYIGGAKVVGGKKQIIWAAKHFNIDEIIFAIPSANEKVRREFFEICKGTSCVIKTLPSYYQLISDKTSVSMLKKVQICDLLERKQINIEQNGVFENICGKNVLVTGAAGSIGSELCRQLAEHRPEKLILFDICENSLYYIQNELKESFPLLDIATVIGSVRDEDRLDYVFSTYKPDIVYHAAAHKHVPLMEDNPNEAVKNNVFGTLNTAQVADKYGATRFVFISTDKAVNPTNVMGATKRICEMIIQLLDKQSKTEFVAVRFGNVLGSNGSVIPIFAEQISKGGPVTVTHPDIIRYFMTIQEAVSLVLQAGKYAKGGEIFILDMGEPVKILNLAENMIRLSGLVPYKDIDILITGLRPGEKIFEELLMSEEGISETPDKRIFVGKPVEIDKNKFKMQLEQLKYYMDDEKCNIRALLKEIVPTYDYSNYTNHDDKSNLVVKNTANKKPMKEAAALTK